MMKLKCLIILPLLLIFTGNAFAQIQTIPITPAYQMPSGFAQPAPSIQGQWPTLQQPPPQPVQLETPIPTTPLAPIQPSEEKPSEFEHFIAGKVPLTVSVD
ncbi:MAG: hypothetical protein CO148_03080, partial [Nitrospirae bacterium CG_4_9_14_3_um_filter_41_27]